MWPLWRLQHQGCGAYWAVITLNLSTGAEVAAVAGRVAGGDGDGTSKCCGGQASVRVEPERPMVESGGCREDMTEWEDGFW